MNNETNINPSVETEQMTQPVVTEPVPVVPEQAVEEAVVAPAEPEMVAAVPEAPAVPEVAAPAVPEMAPASPEVVAEEPAEMATVPEMVAEATEAPVVETPEAPVVAAPAVPEMAPVAPVAPEIQPTVPTTVPEVATTPTVPATVPEVATTPAAPEAVVAPQAADITAQPAAPAVDIPMSNVNVPTIETQPPVEVASNNFADFPMPEETSTTPVTAAPVAAPPSQSAVAGEVIGESKKGNKTIYIILGIIIVLIAVVGAVSFFLTKNETSSNNKPETPTENVSKDVTCSLDTVVRTINVHSEAVIKVDSDDTVSKLEYTHTYSASDQSALNDKHLAAIEYCANPGAETSLGKDTNCSLKEGKIIITSYLDGEENKTVNDYKTVLETQGFSCK